MNYLSITNYKLVFTALLLVTAQFITSCQSTKPNDVQPLVGVAAPNYKVENDRIVFHDDASFRQLRDELLKKNPADLLAWSKATGIKSLGASYLNGTEDSSNEMVNSFGFPLGLAMIINTKGEYQIGNKICWYHEGFRHEAADEQGLANIKSNPENSTSKFIAGVRKIEKVIPDKSARVYGRKERDSRDNKYTQILSLIGVPQRRRHIFSTSIYTERYVSSYPNSIQYFTALDFGIYLEYETQDFFGNWVWRQTQDNRQINYDLQLDAICTVPNSTGVSSSAPNFVGISKRIQDSSFRNSVYLTTLAAADMWVQRDPVISYDDDSAEWDYTITGSISQENTGNTIPGQGGAPGPQPAVYAVSGNLW